MRMDSARIWALHPYALRIDDEVVVTNDGVKVFRRGRFGVRETESMGLWGLQAKVVGYALEHVGRWQAREKRVRPGFHHSPYFPQLRFPREGRGFLPLGVEETYIHFSGVMLVDQKEYRRRLAELHEACERRERINPDYFVCELPETSFWEGDWVRVRDGVGAGKRRLPAGEAFMISGMDYRLDMMRPASEPPPEEKPFCYLQSPQQTPRYQLADRFLMNGGSYWNAEELELVARGNFWRQANGEPLAFMGLDEEAFFFCESGACEIIEHRNSCDLATAVARLKETNGHGLRYENEFIDWGSHQWWEIVRFKDENLGRRVREATLKDGFVIPGCAWIEERARETAA